MGHIALSRLIAPLCLAAAIGMAPSARAETPKDVLVIGHVATRWGLDHFIHGVPLEDLAAQDFGWREGWEYRIS